MGQFYGSIDENHEGYYTQGGALCDPNPNPPNGIREPENKKPLEALEDDSCNILIKAAYAFKEEQDYQNSYDGFRHYIESCAYLPQSYTTFIDVSSTNSQRNNDIHRSEEMREWLKKVLYLNTDTNYYCADVNAMMATFGWFNDTRGRDFKGFLALEYFVVDSSKCKGLADYVKTKLDASWKAAYDAWSDTIPDPDMYTFDSTLPTLDDLGLGILRGNPADVKRFNDAVIGPLVSNVYSMPNPFTSETKISFTCRESAALKFEVFDLLGKKVYDGGSRIFDKGENRIILPAAGIPEGLLYGRFLLPDGSARTIKLRKIE